MLSALLALCEGNYRWIPLTKDPVMWNIAVPFCVSLNKLLNKQYMSRRFDMHWSLFGVAERIYNKIWMNTSHDIYINPWLAINSSWCGHPGTPRGVRSVAAWTGSTVCVYSALSSQKDKSNNKEKTQIGDSTTSREHSLFSNCNHHDFVCSVHIGSVPNVRNVLVSKYGKTIYLSRSDIKL